MDEIKDRGMNGSIFARRGDTGFRSQSVRKWDLNRRRLELVSREGSDRPSYRRYSGYRSRSDRKYLEFEIVVSESRIEKDITLAAVGHDS